jgi:hypothetical protein
MAFYEEADSTGIVEDHIQAVLHLEESEASRVLFRYQDIRKDLIDRLSRIPPGTINAAHLRGVLAQVNGAVEAMTKHLAGETIDSSYKAALSANEDLLSETRVFDEQFLGYVTPINLNAALLADDTANFLVDRYQTNLAAYGNDLMTQISNGLFSASIGEKSSEEVVGSISQFFTAEEWKLRRIVRTELHNVYNLAKIQGMKTIDDQIPGSRLMKTLMHPLDDRTGKDSMYAARLNLVAGITEPFEYMWLGKLRQFLCPPDRPNDRAILVPYRPEWGKAQGGAFIPQ